MIMHAVDEVAQALTDEDFSAEENLVKRQFLLTIRTALLKDARCPLRPSEGGLPDDIREAIEVAVDVVSLVNKQGRSRSAPRQLEAVANAPLVLLVAALLRSQAVNVTPEEIATPRRVCQVLNAMIWT